MLKKIWILLMLITVGLLGGCSQTEPEETPLPPLPSYPVTIFNYTNDGKRTELTFQETPQRVVVTRASAADMLIAMGVGNLIQAAYLPEIEDPQSFGYPQLMPNADILTYMPGPEKIRSYRPDLIIGGRDDFREDTLGDTDDWIQSGILAYIEENTDPTVPPDQQVLDDLTDEDRKEEEFLFKTEYPKLKNKLDYEDTIHFGDMMDFDYPIPGTIEGELAFVSHMGDIFNKPLKASQLADRIIGEIEVIHAHGAEEKPPRVMILEFTDSRMRLYGMRDLVGNMVERLGGKVIGKSGETITPEELTKRNPDVIFVIYGDSQKNKADALSQLQMPVYGNVKAIAKKRVCAFPKRYTEAAGAHTAEALKILGGCLYPGVIINK